MKQIPELRQSDKISYIDYQPIHGPEKEHEADPSHVSFFPTVLTEP